MTYFVRLFKTLLKLVIPKELGVTYLRVPPITILPRGLGWIGRGRINWSGYVRPITRLPCGSA